MPKKKQPLDLAQHWQAVRDLRASAHPPKAPRLYLEHGTAKSFNPELLAKHLQNQTQS